MALIVLTAIAFILHRAKSGPVSPASSDCSCLDFKVPVAVTAHNADFSVVKVDNNIDAVAFTLDIDTWSSPTALERVVKNITVSGTYNISTQLCIPTHRSKKSNLQIATHGLIFDKRYWDATIDPSQYSYVQAAVNAGYSILTYDRLGTGLSDKPDAYTVVQAPLELEILRGLTELARSGDLMKYAQKAKQSPLKNVKVSFDKVIHVGHSFGSFLTSALLTTYGNLSDAAVITGYIVNPYLADLKFSSFGLTYAPESDPALFGDRGSGYLVGATTSALQTRFFSDRANTTSGIGGFDPAVLDYAFSIRQTITTSEVVSPALLNLGIANTYTGPAQFVIAEFDDLVCAGDCRGVYNTTVIEYLLPKAKGIDYHIQPGTGHALTMHHGATLGYKATMDWLASNGL